MSLILPQRGRIRQKPAGGTVYWQADVTFVDDGSGTIVYIAGSDGSLANEVDNLPQDGVLERIIDVPKASYLTSKITSASNNAAAIVSELNSANTNIYIDSVAVAADIQWIAVGTDEVESFLNSSKDSIPLFGLKPGTYFVEIK